MRRLSAPTVCILAATLLFAGLPQALAADPPPTSKEIVERSKQVLAKIDGELPLSRLNKPVEVLRDQWGIPHIYATDTHDLFYAQGVTAAQDRLFQIDLWRRTATGELAEVLGPDAVDRDRMARLVRYRGDMDAEWAGYGPQSREIATAFTDGINDYIDYVKADPASRLPIEFQLAKFQPGKWKPEDVVGRMAGVAMVRNFLSEPARAELIGAVGFDKAMQLMPLDPPAGYSWPIGLDARGLTRDVTALPRKAGEKIRFLPPTPLKPSAAKPSTTARSAGGGDGFDEGSNNWVIAGAHTVSGMPILANDPHRTIALPSLRYLVHLNAPGWNVIGGGEPALPGVAVGHNDKIAWGFTISGHDQADLYVEETHPDDPRKYRVGAEWQGMRVEHETINVLGGKPVELELVFTRHGQVIHEDKERQRVFVLKWAGAEPGTAGYLGSLALNQAGDWESFRKAAAMWRVPSENLIYADVEGNIGWIAAAQTPRRGYGLGVLPVPGANPFHDWGGFLPTDALPTEKNPERGYIGTANANILPPGYDRTIAFEWAAPFRQQRVRGVLTGQVAAKKKHSIDDSMKLQQDNVSLAAQSLVRLAKNLPDDDTALAPYVKLMREWNGDLSVDSKAGPLYAIWLPLLHQEFYAAHVPKPQLEILRTGTPVMLLALANPDARWFAGDPKAARDALLKRTFAAAVEATKRRLGADESKWTWGKMHTARFTHPLASLGTAYAQAFDLGPIARPGDGTTANATSHDPTFLQTAGASYRHIFDLADWDRGVATSTPGQSGQLGSPHYGDLLKIWGEGKYFPLKFSRAAIEEATTHRLTLRPATGGK